MLAVRDAGEMNFYHVEVIGRVSKTWVKYQAPEAREVVDGAEAWAFVDANAAVGVAANLHYVTGQATRVVQSIYWFYRTGKTARVSKVRLSKTEIISEYGSVEGA